MYKYNLRIAQVMSAVVAHARCLLDDLIAAEMRPGGTVEALHTIADREGLSFSALWALRYRPPKDVYGSILIKLAAAHEAMCDRQLARYRAARAATDTTNPLAAALSRIAAAVAGEDHQQEG